ncbi:MAG: 4'-phosphopantetheinyl transferase superfamily protein [Desulfosalsimonadaceae bacterium]
MLKAEIIYPVILKTPPEQQAFSGKDRVLFLRQYARRAVVLSAEKKGVSLSALLNDPDGRPIPAGGFFWSLSHKPEIVAGVVAGQPVGIDIEMVRPAPPGLMKRITDAEERRLAEPVTDLVFFRFWTAKEAVLKAVGVGLRGLSHCKIHRIMDEKTLIVSCHQKFWRVKHAFHDHHVASVACQNHPVEWRWFFPESGQ